MEFYQEDAEIFPTPGGEPAFSIPRADMLPYDPARPHLPPQKPTEKPGQFKLFLGSSQDDVTRPPRHFPMPQSKVYPAPRTRMVAPESRNPPVTRRLIVDTPTEQSMTPLEVLAKGTVPPIRQDQSIFGTPKSRLLESLTPLEQLSAGLRDNFQRGFDDIHPVERTRFQAKEQHRMKMRIPGASFDYNSLPGVKTGTTAVGLVEHRDNSQPLFHVPVFTTPIPKNGQFLNLNPNPLRSFQSGLKRLKSSIADKLPKIPSPADGLNRLKRIFGGNVGAAQEVRDIQITPAPKHLTRRLDTFSRYTRFGNSSRSLLSSLPLTLLCIVVSGLLVY